MAGKLSVVDKKQLECFIQADQKQFNLLYSFTTDGADASTFHQLCDKKGPTVTVIYNTRGTVYGGFTENSWASESGVYVRDDHAFLFRLQHNGDRNPAKFPVRKPEYAIRCKNTHGPIFGADIITFEGALTKKDSQFTLNGGFTYHNSYDMGACSIGQFSNDLLTITDLEVYSVSDTVPLPAWRQIGGWKKQVKPQSH
ncbi:uncharacterized protein LOC132736865 [Ruditapes philippinarum]|uniref:uncharacterized protein LOC132736865 n=1 Tax=Ruditapes philippinarum TaxID=129788 RepID=UPI00295A5B78|nr:uncharacterized protein LOC132736865 [Ruditapes philippinarum]XP_060580069.1 uncharacterized protein LOC132736865 [Ruditapes philippinarum]XP_060580070.1 uncharacterized protein LOC132736865 [Ruditapes philippinarum]